MINGRSPFPTVPTPPYIPGNGVAGTVTAVGPATDPSWLGRTVVTPTGGAAGYAELAVADAATALPVPDGGEVGRAALGLIGDGGRFVVFGGASGSMTDTSGPEIAARGIEVSGLADFATLGDITALAADALAEAAAGRLRPTIGQTFPLDRAADAHAAIESRAALGKTLLTVAG